MKNIVLSVLCMALLSGVGLTAQEDFSKKKSIRSLYMDGVWDKGKIGTLEIQLETKRIILMERDSITSTPAYAMASVFRKDPPPAPTETQKKNGYLLFFRNYLYDVFPFTNPTREEIEKKEIKVIASLGEFEPITFGVYPLIDLKNCKVNISEFINEKGDKLSPDSFKLNSVMNWRTVREDKGIVVIRAHVLMEVKDIPRIDEGISKQIWINVKVAENAKPGEYKGKVSFAPAGKPASDIPVTVKVLPFKLMQPPPEVFNWAPIMAGTWKFDQLEKEFIFIKEHGMTGEMTDCLGPKYAGDKLGDDYTNANKYMEIAKKVGLPGKFVVFNWHCQGGSKYDAVYGPYGRGDAQFNDSSYRQLTEALTGLKKNADENKWLPFSVYLTTELGSVSLPEEFQKTMKKSAEYYAAARKVKGLNLLATFNRQEQLKMHWDLPTLDAIGFNGEMFPEWEAASKKKESWMTFIMSDQRCGYGLYMWKYNFRGCRPWCLSLGDDGDQLAYFMNNEYHATVRFERIREGVDDYKYMYTMMELVKQAKAKGKDTSAAETLSKKILEAIPSVHYKFTDFDYMKLDEFRKQMADQIIKLTN